MEFVGWCERVLRVLAVLLRSTPNADLIGVPEHALGGILWEPADDARHSTMVRRAGLLGALEELARLDWVEPRLQGWWRITGLGQIVAQDSAPLWQAITAYEQLDPEAASLVRQVNRLSARAAGAYARLEAVDEDALVAALGWMDGPERLRQVARPLWHRSTPGALLRGSSWHRAGRDDLYPTVYYATYVGLVWDGGSRVPPG